YHTHMSIEFQFTVKMPVSQRKNWQRSTSFSACPAVPGPPKRIPVLPSLHTMSLVSLYVENFGPYCKHTSALPAPSSVSRDSFAYHASHCSTVPFSGPSHLIMVRAGSSP